MSLIVTSVLVVSGVLLGRWIAKGGRQKEQAPSPPLGPPPAQGEPVKEPPNEPSKPAAPVDLFADMPCKLGDVVMRTGGDEAWLAGGLVFVEQHPVSALFVAPEAGNDRALYVRARPSGEIFWLEPVAPGEIMVGAEPPTSLEHGAVRYDRLRRLPVKVQRAGSGAPDVGDQVIVAEYASSGFERLVVVTGSGTARVWAGTVLEEGMYDVLPSGKATLET